MKLRYYCYYYDYYYSPTFRKQERQEESANAETEFGVQLMLKERKNVVAVLLLMLLVNESLLRSTKLCFERNLSDEVH